MSPANDTQYFRALGALYGQATGDALGTTLEFKGESECRRLYPEGLREIVGGGAFRVVPGQVTDDTEMAMALAGSLGREGCYDSTKVFEAYQRWANSHPIDMGCATSQALRGNHPNSTTEANGALMRVSPLGVFAWKLHPLEAAKLGRLDASLTHPAKVCQDASGIFVATIARCIRLPGRTAREVFDFAKRGATLIGATECLEDLNRAEAGDLGFTGGGHVRLAFRLAFHHLLSTPTFEEGVVNTVMRGGDADTNGCIVGALLGAFHGMRRIPAKWVHTVALAKVHRPDEFQATGLERHAELLLNCSNIAEHEGALDSEFDRNADKDSRKFYSKEATQARQESCNHRWDNHRGQSYCIRCDKTR